MDDGYRYIYIYDSRNRLVQVNRRDPSPNSADHVGTVFAKFSYNALGWRTSAVYDLHDGRIGSESQLEGTPGAGGGGRSESRGRVEDGGDGGFADETIEYYSYDDQWRLIAIERQGPVITSGTNAGKRPAPRHYQRIVYSPTEQRGFGGGSIPTDVPIMRLRDTTGDGIYDETLYYLHNRHGDVVAMYQPRLAKPEPGASVFDQPSPTDPRRALVLERYTYSLYGEPDCVQPLDVNGDGIVNVMGQVGGDGGTPISLLSDTTAFETAMSAPPFDSSDPVGGSLRADVDGDGYLTKWDEEYFNAYSYIHQLAQQDAMDLFNGWNIGDVENLGTWDGRGELSRWHEVGQTSDGEISIRLKHSAWIALDNRLGYAGYVWDPHLKLYHVRHRVYDPREGTWLQEDPIGIAGGLNLHEYCNSDPINFVDPMGLDWQTRVWGAVGLVGNAAGALVSVAAGLAAAPETGGASLFVGGGLALYFGAEASASLNELITGESTAGPTELAARAIAENGGGSEAHKREVAQAIREQTATATLGAASWLSLWATLAEGAAAAEAATDAHAARTVVAEEAGLIKPTNRPSCAAPAPAPKPPVSDVQEIDPRVLRSTQRTAGRGPRNDGPAGTKADAVREMMADGAWPGGYPKDGVLPGPIDVVVTPDGLVTVDHTRVAVAIEQGWETVPARLHLPSDPLPKGLLESGRFRDAQTWGEAIALRSRRQIPPLGPTGMNGPAALPPPFP